MDEARTAARALLAETPGLAEALHRVLDRVESKGGLPRTLTLKLAPEVAQALGALLSRRAVEDLGAGKYRLSLRAAARTLSRGPGAKSSGDAGLVTLLYDAVERTPEDPRAERRGALRELGAGLEAVGRRARSAVARAYVREQVEAGRQGQGDLAGLAVEAGVERSLEEARRVVACVDAAIAHRGFVRLANFSTRALGDSKALRPGGDLWRRVGRALYAHDPATPRLVFELGPRSSVPAHELSLEARGVYRDVAAGSVVCFGPLRYESGGERFEDVARHARLGDVCRLTVQQLRDARWLGALPSRVTVIENLTPFLDYVDRVVDAGAEGELVVCSSGQASWAVVALLKLVAERQVPVRHCGDLDRSGVLILRSLARRSGCHITPWHMDEAKHARYLTEGLPLGEAEAGRLRALLAADDPRAPGHGVLCAVAESGLWIEQEVFGQELVP